VFHADQRKKYHQCDKHSRKEATHCHTNLAG